ncbi:phenol degradation protein meta [Pandoraea pneumonica]|uniref:Phenol degradation protein meta n=1 Tax=Pandoraea pneumonica TaxID=2508299 RepID=A0A5E4XLJ1_9BURK|nr:transporter [Pandoraea pneumonica]VVE36998.1 phenol degradation protein meta [Pandoraea pneumonica]
MLKRIVTVFGVGLSLGLPLAARGTEGALGRPISGTGVTPDAGIVPPEPGWFVNLAEIYYDGSISSSRAVPVGGKTTLGLEAKVSFTLATLLKVWDTGTGPWNFASSVTLPYAWTSASAALGIGNRTPSIRQDASGLFDLTFTPLTAGYHFSKTDHISFSVNIWAPTGKYDPGSIANVSLNNWTFIPTVSYTKLVPSIDAEFNVSAGVQFYTRNSATDYQNAPLFTLDVLALKRFANGLGAGVIVGTVQQVDNDSGPTADRLNGFRGYDWSIGPIVTYDTKIGGKNPLSLTLRWVPTVASKNRLSSTSTVMATATIGF